MIVITGAAGFIGSNLVAELNDRGRDDLILCDTLGEDLRWLNLRKRTFRNIIHIDKIFDFLSFLYEKSIVPEAVIHLGANTSTTSTDAHEILENNYSFTLSWLQFCAVYEVPFIYASSASTYGDGKEGFIDDPSLDALKKLRPLNLYGWSKHLVDKVIAERRENHLPLPPKCIGLKFFNVYGPNEYHKFKMMSVVGKNYDCVKNGESVPLFDGEPMRDFVYVKDAADVILWMLDNGPKCGLFNVGTGVARYFEDMVNAMGLPPRIAYQPIPESLRSQYQMHTCASTYNLIRAGYTKRFMSVEEGVAKYVEYLQSEDRYR